MNYQEFNRRVFEFYISRPNSTFFTFSIDKYQFDQLIYNIDLDTFIELRDRWIFLLENDDKNLPQYFGIIAIQCLAASQMHNDGYYSSNAYQVRLIEILNLDDNNELQILFRGDNVNNPIQERIWYSAKSYLKKEFNYELSLPKKRSKAGRYVQYPISQALLNTEDLKLFTCFFSEEFRVKEKIRFDYFKNRLVNSLTNIDVSKKIDRLLTDENKKELCFRQLFEFYNDWDGEIYSKLNKKKKNIIVSKITNSPKMADERLVLILENNSFKFYLNINPIDNVLLLDRYKYLPSKDLMIFQEMEHYDCEYENSRFIYEDEICFILLNISLKRQEYRYLEDNNIYKWELGNNYMLYQCKFNPDNKIHPFRKYISDRILSLDGGLKIGIYNYLVGFGPQINCLEKHRILHQDRQVDYDPETAAAGVYKIRVDNFKDLEFQLTKSYQNEELISVFHKSQILNIYNIPTNKLYIDGCFLLNINYSDDDVREWIDVNLEREGIKEYQGNNISIKTLKNSLGWLT